MASADIECTLIKLGNNLDPSKNFYIAVPDNADGTLTIARCSGGTPVATIDATGKVTFPGNAQTWQDVAASRAVGVTYTNDTDQTISVIASFTSNTVNGEVLVTVSGKPLYTGAAQSHVGWLIEAAKFDVPARATYKIDATAPATIISWQELR